MPSRDTFLGIDVGTTGVKATLIDRNGKVMVQRRVEYPTFHLRPLWVEQNPWDWWRATCSAIREVTKFSEEGAGNIRGVGVSGQAPSLLGIDAEGQPLGNAFIWMDRRSEQECGELATLVGKETIQNISGNRIDPYYMLPKLLWQKKHQRDRYERAKGYVQANGWIIYRLTKKASIDISHAALTQLYHISEQRWDASLIRELGLSLDKLPDIYRCMEIVGHVTSEAASLLGLNEGIPVVAGAIDGATAPLGLKLIKPNQAFEMSGQSSGIGVILDQPVTHPNLALLKHAVDGQWILKGSMSATGGSLQWFRDQLDGRTGQVDAFSDYEKLVRTIPAGSKGLIFLPYLAGERAPLWDSHARGMFFGLQLSTDKAQLIRSIMEGTAYGLKTIQDELRNAGWFMKSLLGTGGGYFSKEWSQIKADILGTEIKVLSTDVETASLGAAYLALLCVTGGTVADLPESKIITTYVPNLDHQKIYQSGYFVFKSLYQRNKELFQAISSVDLEK
ncbi:xylulokinase [Ammoniphilus resinae]|uniref:Xylulokinase n=1 Tax=Ammoniphilus resinae TaxID=861532 RepID=A0ABS4GWE8_9BACL|nr:FGGY family carbohydrate kinase [Ammoniphilus resinae]MBP1934571.1 xylulokinase [Ammoniphilus resinae]